MPDEPITTDEEQAELTPFQRFEAFARRLVAVPKREINESIKKERERR